MTSEIIDVDEIQVIEVGIPGAQGAVGLLEIDDNGNTVVVPVGRLDFYGAGFTVTPQSGATARVELDLSGVTAGGELGGTLDAPTVDALHSGSTHQSLTDNLNAHQIDVVDAHDASAVSFVPTGTITSSDAQSAIVEALTDGKAYTDDGHVILTSQRGAASGVASLDSSGKVPVAQVPTIAFGNTFVVASQAAMLALAANPGDIAVRSDISETFILTAFPASTLGNWVELLSGAGGVTSVNGATGAVTGVELTANKGAISGYASLDGSGYVPDGQINSTIARDTEVASAISTTEAYADTKDAAHVAASDPHPTYETAAEAQALVDVHTANVSAAHGASAVSFTPGGTVAATNVQAAIAEVASEVASGANLPFASPTISLSAVAATGSAASVIHSDATIVAFDVTNPTTSAVGDSAATGVASRAARRDHGHAREGFGTPSTQAFADTAVTGTATTIPHSDHKHAMPVNPVIVHEAASDPHPVYETAAEAQALVDVHTASAADAHDASAVSFVPVGTIAATDAQAAVAEVDADLTAHSNATTDVQAAIAEAVTEGHQVFQGAFVPDDDLGAVGDYFFKLPDRYGQPINANSLANIDLKSYATPLTRRVSYRFRAEQSSNLSSLMWYKQAGGAYGGGTGGSVKIAVQADDGTANHFPSGADLASQTQTTANTPAEIKTVTFSSPTSLVAGSLYHIVFTNADGSPITNFVSVNSLYTAPPQTNPLQPRFADTDWAALYRYDEQVTWHVDMGYTPILALTYANAASQGMGVFESWRTTPDVISGTTRTRETFTVSGGNRSVASVSVCLNRTSGTDDLIITLETGAGVLIEAVRIPAATIAVGLPSKWYTANFNSSHTLTNGATYHLMFTTASSTTYSIYPMVDGSTQSFPAVTYYADGTAQHDPGTGTWANDTLAGETGDFSFYLDPPLPGTQLYGPKVAAGWGTPTPFMSADVLSVVAALATHTGDTSAAHAASAVAFTPNGSIAATDVQAAIQEVRDEAGGAAATDYYLPTGITAENFSRGLAFSATGAPSQGTLRAAAIALPAGFPVPSLNMLVTATPSATTTNSWMALLDSSRNVIRQSTDKLTQDWAASTMRTQTQDSIPVTAGSRSGSAVVTLTVPTLSQSLSALVTAGDSIVVSNANVAAYNGTFTVSSTTGTTIVYTCGGSATDSLAAPFPTVQLASAKRTYTTAVAGLYYACFMVKATTRPTMMSSNPGVTTMFQIAPILAGEGNASLTGTCPSPASAFTTGINQWTWVGVS